MKANDKPIIIEETFKTSLESIWNALTDINQMRKWYFENIPAFEPVIGFETEFNVKSDERNFLHQWKVTEVKPPEMIKYEWQYEDYPGRSATTFELKEQDDQVLLKLTVDVLEDFPDDIPEFRKESCIDGWEYFIKDRLKTFLNTYNK